MSTRHPERAAGALLTLLTICALACAAPNPHATGAADSGATSPDASQSTLKSSPEAIAHAQALGFPPVPEGSPVIGPLAGPEGSIFYAERSGKVSYFVPDQKSAFFGQVDAQGQVAFLYAVRPDAFYAIRGQEQTRLASPPAELEQWPYADPIFNVMIQVIKAHQQELEQQSAQQQADYQRRAFSSRKMHEINMNILRNMGGDSCTKHYEGTYYLGCW